MASSSQASSSCVVFVAVLMLACLQLTLANEWIANAELGGFSTWTGVAVSGDGTKQVAVSTTDIHLSDDGIVWSIVDTLSYNPLSDPGVPGVPTSTGVAMSNNGDRFTVISEDGVFTATFTLAVYTYSKAVDGGVFRGVAMSSDGNVQTILDARGLVLMQVGIVDFVINEQFATLQDFSGGIYAGSEGGADILNAVAMSGNGRIQTVVGNNADYTVGIVITTQNEGILWQHIPPPPSFMFGNLQSVCMSLNGRHQVAVGDDQVWVSTDSGDNWVLRDSAPSSMAGCSITGNGEKVVLVGEPNIWSSYDFGLSWIMDTTIPADANFKIVSMSNDGNVATAAHAVVEIEATLWNYNSDSAPSLSPSLTPSGSPTASLPTPSLPVASSSAPSGSPVASSSAPSGSPVASSADTPILCETAADCLSSSSDCKPLAVMRRRRLFGQVTSPEDFCHDADGSLELV